MCRAGVPTARRILSQLVRLKQKMGNRSNASAETEWRGAFGLRIGEEGRGVATIIDMVAMTRFDCIIGSAGGMRAATMQAIDWTRQRQTFGATLARHPIMAATLADLAIESEAALALGLRLARALDAASKACCGWRCRSANIGCASARRRMPMRRWSAGAAAASWRIRPMPRLYREAPVNAIWEGSGNIQALDVLRALQREPEAKAAYFKELAAAHGAYRALDEEAVALHAALDDLSRFEAQARSLCDRMAVALQASVLARGSAKRAADAFVASRIAMRGAHHFGALAGGRRGERDRRARRGAVRLLKPPAAASVVALDEVAVDAAFHGMGGERVAGGAAKSLEIGDGAWVGRQNFERAARRHVLQRFLGLEDGQRAVEAPGVQRRIGHRVSP